MILNLERNKYTNHNHKRLTYIHLFIDLTLYLNIFLVILHPIITLVFCSVYGNPYDILCKQTKLIYRMRYMNLN